jgi:topoisomerase-4 subunit A
VAELPILNKGKGQKLIQIPRKKFQASEEYMVGIAVLSAQDSLSVNYDNGKTRLLKPVEQEAHVGDRALRGRKLEKKRGYNSITGLGMIIGKS